MYDEAIADSLASLKLITDWFVTSKMIKKLYTALHAIDNIIYFNWNSGEDVFCCNEMGIPSIDLNNIYLDDSFNEDDPDAIILIKISARQIKFGKSEAF